MRPDMGKCVIERPRHGSRWALSAKAHHYGRLVYYSDGPEYEGPTLLPASSKQQRFATKLGDKTFSDVLGPLRNYLRTNCGRPWNDVYSEIARTLGRSGSWGVRHVVSAHVDVAVHTYRGIDGNIWACDERGVHQVGTVYSNRFYVEPETGILREDLRRRRRSFVRVKREATPPDYLPIEDGRAYRKVGGIWYLHEFSEVEVKTPLLVRGSFAGWTYQSQVVCTLKQQLNKKQLKQLGLRNG